MSCVRIEKYSSIFPFLLIYSSLNTIKKVPFIDTTSTGSSQGPKLLTHTLLAQSNTVCGISCQRHVPLAFDLVSHFRKRYRAPLVLHAFLLFFGCSGSLLQHVGFL